MCKFAALQYWIIFVAHLILDSAEAVSFSDEDRVLLIYNTQTDLCYGLTTSSCHEAKEAANEACKWAFQALDRLEGNSCTGWRRAECRQLQLPEFHHFQCSCSASYWNELKDKIKEITAFRDCAWKVYAQEILDQQTPAVSTRFRWIYQKIYLDAVTKVQQRRAERMSPEAGTSHASKRQRTGGVFSGTEGIQGGSTSQSFDVPIGVDTSHGEDASEPPGNHRPHVCGVCGRQYATEQILKDHEVSHVTDLRCNSCNLSFSNRGNLNLHMRNVHAINVRAEPGLSVDPAPASTSDEPGVYACEFCEKRYRWKSNLYAHRKVHRERVRCDVCRTDYTNKANYKKHMRKRHREVLEAEEAEEKASQMIAKNHVCDQCGARFTAKKRLQEHKALHRGETYCDQCDIYFARKALLNIHRKKRHPEPK